MLLLTTLQYSFFIKCHFNLHLRPDKKVDSIQKLLKLVMLHIWYKLGYSSDQNFWRILGSSTFMSHEKNFHKTRGDQNSCHERSRWLQNSSIILIGILVEKAADFTLCSLLDHSNDAPSKDYVKPKLERLKRKSSNDNSPNNSFGKEENSNSFELELQREKNNPNSKSSSSSSSPSSSSSSKSSKNSSRKNSSNENITIKNGLQLQVINFLDLQFSAIPLYRMILTIKFTGTFHD